MSEPAKKQLTFREYDQLPEGTPYQLIGGDLTMTLSPTFLHQKCLASVGNLLFAFVKERQLGEVVFAPMDVYLTDVDVYQPDIIYISQDRKGIIGERIHGAPDLVVEILSPSTAYDDIVRKKRTYQLVGVQEYWIVDPQEGIVEIYRNRGQEFELASKAHGTGLIGSTLLTGLEVDLSRLF